MKTPYHVIKNVKISEKTTHLSEHRQYTFIVDPRASKQQIAAAVAQIFERKVAAVNVLSVKGKTRRTRFGRGQTPDLKKAVVTLKEGEKPIEFV